MNEVTKKIIDCASDLVVSADPYANGKQDGDQFVSSLIDLIRAAAELNSGWLDFDAILSDIKGKIVRE